MCLVLACVGFEIAPHAVWHAPFACYPIHAASINLRMLLPPHADSACYPFRAGFACCFRMLLPPHTASACYPLRAGFACCFRMLQPTSACCFCLLPCSCRLRKLRQHVFASACCFRMLLPPHVFASACVCLRNVAQIDPKSISRGGPRLIPLEPH